MIYDASKFHPTLSPMLLLTYLFWQDIEKINHAFLMTQNLCEDSLDSIPPILSLSQSLCPGT